MHLKVPFIDTVITFNTQTQKTEATISAASKDLQDVKAVVAVNYAHSKAEIRNIYQSVGDNEMVVAKIITPAVQESVKAATAVYSAEELITKRADVRNLIIQNMKEKVERFGVSIQDVNIIDFAFSPAFNQAIEGKVRVEQEALTEKNQLEKIKYKAQQQVEQQRGIADAQVLQAEANAKATKINAQADAEAITIKTKAIQQQ